MEPQLDIYTFPNQIATLDIAIKEENEKLGSLAVERKKKVKPHAEEAKKVTVRDSGKTAVKKDVKDTKTEKKEDDRNKKKVVAKEKK